MKRRYLADASTLIALSACGRLGVLRTIVERVHVTNLVVQEVLVDRPGTSSIQAAIDAGWIKIIGSAGSIGGLGPGDASTILAAKAGDVVILDDRAARLEAKARGLRLTGLLGLIVSGAQSEKITPQDAVQTLDDLARGDFRMTSDLYRWALSKLHE